MAFTSGPSSLSSATFSSSLSAPNSPFATSNPQHGINLHKTSPTRRAVVSAPADFNPVVSQTNIQPFQRRKSSLASSSSTSSNELLIIKTANAATNKRKRATKSTGSSPTTGGFGLSFLNVYTTTDRNGRARVGSGSGAPAGCSVM